MYVDQALLPGALGGGLHIGQVAPLHCSAGGKVLLAFGAAELDDEPLERFPSTTITDRELLAKELDLVRSRGFALMIDEYELGLRAVAAPVTEKWGEVVGALAVSGPSVRLPKRRLSHCAGLLLRASSALSGQLAVVSARDESWLFSRRSTT